MRITHAAAPVPPATPQPPPEPTKSLVLWCLDGPQTKEVNGIDWLMNTLCEWCFEWDDVERELKAMCGRGAHTRDEQTALSMLLFYAERLVARSPHADDVVAGSRVRYALLERVWAALVDPPGHVADTVARAYLNAKATLTRAILERCAAAADKT